MLQLRRALMEFGNTFSSLSSFSFSDFFYLTNSNNKIQARIVFSWRRNFVRRSIRVRNVVKRNVIGCHTKEVHFVRKVSFFSLLIFCLFVCKRRDVKFWKSLVLLVWAMKRRIRLSLKTIFVSGANRTVGSMAGSRDVALCRASLIRLYSTTKSNCSRFVWTKCSM